MQRNNVANDLNFVEFGGVSWNLDAFHGVRAHFMELSGIIVN
jgi:hypothetical protein